MKSDNRVVSIITPSFNRADIIAETAQSIFRQSYPYWEWVIVDDGSTDVSWEVLQQFAERDRRVKIFKRDREPKGAAVCRNIAIENSTGDYLIFLDTDDLLAPFCLQQRVEAASKKPECDFIIFPMLMFYKKPDDTRLLWNIDTGENDLARILRSDPVCQGTGTLWKKQSFVDIGLWREDLKIWQDIELHIRAIVNGAKFEKRLDLPPDVFLRVSDVSLSRTGFHSVEKVQSRISVFEYALSEIMKREPDNPERDALKIMGFSLLAGALTSGYFSEANHIRGLCEKSKLFNRQQRSLFSCYRVFRIMKGYKIPYSDPVFNMLIRKCSPPAAQTVGKIKYNKEIIY